MSTTSKPAVGEGATLRYPDDCYGYVVIGVSALGSVITVQRLKPVSKATGHEPAYFNGAFPVWSHHYTPEELVTLIDGQYQPEKAYRRGDGSYRLHGTTMTVGRAYYRRDYSL